MTERPSRSVSLLEWVRDAEPGDQHVYFRGELHQSAETVRRDALDLEAGGTVLLVQKRHGFGDYSYIAIRTSQERVKRASGR